MSQSPEPFASLRTGSREGDYFAIAQHRLRERGNPVRLLHFVRNDTSCQIASGFRPRNDKAKNLAPHPVRDKGSNGARNDILGQPVDNLMVFFQEKVSKVDEKFVAYNDTTLQQRQQAIERLWGKNFENLSCENLPRPPKPPILLKEVI